MPTRNDLPPVALSEPSANRSRASCLQTLVDAFPAPAAFVDAKLTVLAANSAFQQLALPPASACQGQSAGVHRLKDALAQSVPNGAKNWELPCELETVPFGSQSWSARWSRHRLAGKRVLLVQLERDALDTELKSRQRLGLELHDNIGQKLTALSLLAHELHDELSAENHPAAKVAQRLVDGVRHTFAEIQHLARNAFSAELSNSELPAALSRLAEQTTSNAAVRCTVEVQGTGVLLRDGSATHLYRIAQEAVSNAIRHARARTIAVRLQSTESAVTLTIEDDGVGISTEQESKGVGLRTMDHRATLIGGRLQLHSLSPTGTRVACTVPRETPL